VTSSRCRIDINRLLVDHVYIIREDDSTYSLCPMLVVILDLDRNLGVKSECIKNNKRDDRDRGVLE
jgi:hypothetical protein